MLQNDHKKAGVITSLPTLVDEDQPKDVTLLPRFSRKRPQLYLPKTLQKCEDEPLKTPMQLSPRSKFLKQKFPKFDENEVVLDNFNCAYSCQSILLQGMLYITDQYLYFYSPFNAKTIIGKGSKLVIAFSEIASIKKELTLLIFPDAIRLSLKNGEQILLKSFVSRDTCYSFILSRMMSLRGPEPENIQRKYSRAVRVAVGLANHIKDRITGG